MLRSWQQLNCKLLATARRCGRHLNTSTIWTTSTPVTWHFRKTGKMCSLRCCWSSLHRLIQDVLPYRSGPHCGVSAALVLRGLRAQLCGFNRPMRARWGGCPGVGSSYHTARTAKLVQALVLWHLFPFVQNGFRSSLLCSNVAKDNVHTKCCVHSFVQSNRFQLNSEMDT